MKPLVMYNVYYFWNNFKNKQSEPLNAGEPHNVEQNNLASLLPNLL